MLKYREEIISAKVAKEHTEETLKSEIMFLKSQVMGEQQEKGTLEETLTHEINSLQSKICKLLETPILVMNHDARIKSWSF